MHRSSPACARPGSSSLGATNLSEWANIRSSRSTSGWSAVGGLTGNPWALDRSAGGSSSGSGAAVAGGLAPLAVGTETDGSITCPSSLNGCVGLKPTVGLAPTDGIVPISGSQDAPGPLSRSVHDAALLLDALTGDVRLRRRLRDGRRFADVQPRRRRRVAQRPSRNRCALRGDARHPARPRHGACPTPTFPSPETFDADELVVLLAELQTDLDAYLAGRARRRPCSLADVVAFNREHAAERARPLRPGALRAGAHDRRPSGAGVRRGARPQSRSGAPRSAWSPPSRGDGRPRSPHRSRLRAGLEERSRQRRRVDRRRSRERRTVDRGLARPLPPDGPRRRAPGRPRPDRPGLFRDDGCSPSATPSSMRSVSVRR